MEEEEDEEGLFPLAFFDREPPLRIRRDDDDVDIDEDRRCEGEPRDISSSRSPADEERERWKYTT